MPPNKTAQRFWIDPSMSDQQILDMIMSIKNRAEGETGDIALEEDDGSASYDSKAEEIDASQVS